MILCLVVKMHCTIYLNHLVELQTCLNQYVLEHIVEAEDENAYSDYFQYVMSEFR